MKNVANQCKEDLIINLVNLQHLYVLILIEALKIWLENYKVDYKAKDNSVSNNNELIEKSITKTKKELEKEKIKLNKVYDFLENGTYNKNEFLNRSKVIKCNIESLNNKLKEYKEILYKNSQIQNEKETIIHRLKNVIDLYYKLETAEDKNILLKSIVAKITYLKTEKDIKKDSDKNNCELHIYPKIHKV